MHRGLIIYNDRMRVMEIFPCSDYHDYGFRLVTFLSLPFNPNDKRHCTPCTLLLICSNSFVVRKDNILVKD